MSFIGFLVKKKDEKIFEKLLKDTILECPISINERSIFNIKNVHFETIVLDRNIKEGYESDLNEIIKSARYLIINIDSVDIAKIKNVDLTIITYGFSSKSTITASSVEDDGLLICLQRSIEGIYGQIVEPQELCIKDEIQNPYLKMAIGAMKLLYNRKRI